MSLECGVRVKEEPGLEHEAAVKQEEGWEPVKQEPSAAAAAGLYAGHEIKSELVLGPTALQPPDAAFSSAASQNARMSPAEDKRANNKILEASVKRQTDDESKPKGPPGAGAASEPYSCDGCGKQFAWKWSLMRHMRQNAEKCNLLDYKLNSGTKPFQCDICLKNVSNILVHKRIHTGEKPFECEICLKQFSQSSNLLRHKYLHLGEKPYKCDICLKRFTQSSTLRQHKQIHTVSTRLSPCAERYQSPAAGLRPAARRPDQPRLRACSVRLERLPAEDKRARSTTLGASVESQPNDGIKPKGPPGAGAASALYSCDACGEQFARKRRLIRHIRLQSPAPHAPAPAGSVPYVVPGKRCSAPTAMSTPDTNLSVGCSRESISSESHAPGKQIPMVQIVEHDHCYTKIHTGEKPYKCEICKKQFSHENNLNNHKYIHTDEKPYECEICKKKFSQKRLLHSHKYIHTDEKPYKCEMCKKQFTQKSYLVSHKYIHTDEKPYKCEICKKQFTQKSNLVCHKYIHTGEKPYKCEICKKQFSHKSILNNHKYIHLTRKHMNAKFVRKSFHRNVF